MTRPNDIRTRRAGPAERSRRAFARALATAALPLAILCAAVALAAGGSGGATPRTAATIRAAGSVTMANSKAPGAILTASGMKPGGQVQGDVTITNTGDAAAYVLSSSHLSDTAGPLSGPPLSGHLQLLIQDITGATPATVYSGAFGAMPSEALGTLAANEARTYHFSVTLPNGGTPPSDTTGDNVYRGAASTIQFDWAATGSSTGGGGDTGGGNTGGGTVTTGGGTVTTGGGTVSGAGGSTGQVTTGSVLKLKFATKQKAKNGVSVSASCRTNCTATFSANVSVPGAGKSYSLAKVVKALRAGRVTTIKLTLSSKARKAVDKALAKHKKVTAKVQVTVRGSSASSQRIIVTLTK